jgi:hypothetical protein
VFGTYVEQRRRKLPERERERDIDKGGKEDRKKCGEERVR